jgi:transcriptional regulator with XRE-family HTH domain
MARGFSVYELAAKACVMPRAIRDFESGRPADKRSLPALAAALGVRYCLLLCGEHSCAERACVSAARPEAPD